MDRPIDSCARPALIFCGEYVHRTLNGAMATIASLLTSAMLAAVAVFVLKTGEELLVNIVSIIFALVALIFGGLGLWTLWGWICHRRVRVEINEEGILYGNRFWPWDGVRSFAGTRYDNGVCLEFTPRRSIVWGGGKMPTTPLLTDQQYVELARKLDQCVSARFPHIVVAMEPLDAAADP